MKLIQTKSTKKKYALDVKPAENIKITRFNQIAFENPMPSLNQTVEHLSIQLQQTLPQLNMDYLLVGISANLNVSESELLRLEHSKCIHIFEQGPICSIFSNLHPRNQIIHDSLKLNSKSIDKMMLSNIWFL